MARAALNGIKEGLFLISCNLEGLALSIATAGMAPQPSPLYAIVEILTAGIMRVVALITLSQWSQQIRTWHRLVLSDFHDFLVLIPNEIFQEK